MLQALRSSAAGIISKVLFALLILAFAVWGIGDYAFLRRADPTAVSVGSETITTSQLSEQYRREVDRLRRSLGHFDAEAARQFGVMDQVIDRLVARILWDREARKLGVAVGDDMVRGYIVADPAFRDPRTQSFDRGQYLRLLSENGYSEQRFVELMRGELSRAHVTGAIEAGSWAPEPLVDRLFRHRQERRVGEYVLVTADSVSAVGEPDAAQLQVTYDEHVETTFTAPEYRAVSFVRVNAEELLPSVQASDEQLREEFARRATEFRVPERRELEQMLFGDEEAAKAAYDKIAAGAAFNDVAREALSMSPEQTALGLVTREAIMPEIAGAVFRMDVGTVSQPLRSPFGWHLIRVARIEPGKEPTFEDLRERLSADLRLKLAGDAAYEVATKLEDAVNAGASLEEAAPKVNLTAHKVAAVDLKGLGPDGKPVSEFAGATDVLAATFETQAGRESALFEARSGGWYIVRIDGVTPSRVKPLDEVRSEVVALWQKDKRYEAARERAELILDRVNKGQTLAAAAAEFQLTPAQTPPVLRDGGRDLSEQVTPELVGRLFALKQGESGFAAGRDRYHVVRLLEVRPADPASEPQAVARLRQALVQQIAADLVAEYAQSLRRQQGVSVKQDAIEPLL
ncbi:MAG: peptidyl-prolyl cis-trans isomerase [Proteobacteria bacterium]|nr:peptidyl-prolyl cis-trans isomerase [Pseudomonadota bacterium]